jgi:beta-glucosidase
VDLPDILDYDIIESDATYLYFRGDPLYPFGHGLTYTTVEYRNLRLSADTAGEQDEVTVSVDVHNTGHRDTDEVVQLYTRQRQSVVKQPVRQLRDFRRVPLGAGETRTVELRIRAADLGFWDVTRGRYAVESAAHTVMVGRSSADIRAYATLTVSGETIPDRDPLGGPIAAVDHDSYAGVVVRDADRTDRDRHRAEREPADAVTATEHDAWILFSRVDLGRRPTGCRAQLGRIGGGAARVTLRLDDPLDGTVLATLATSGAEDRLDGTGPADWSDVDAVVQPVDGVRDVYAVFEAPGVSLRTLRFTG